MSYWRTPPPLKRHALHECKALAKGGGRHSKSLCKAGAGTCVRHTDGMQCACVQGRACNSSHHPACRAALHRSLTPNVKRWQHYSRQPAKGECNSKQ